MYSYGSPHMAVQKQDDQHEHTFSSYVRIRDVVLKTYLGRWTIGRSGERGSGISVLPARHDNDDDCVQYHHFVPWNIQTIPVYYILSFFYIYLFFHGLAFRVFADGPGDLGSIPGRVIPKTEKMVLDASLLNTQHYMVRIKGKVEQSREGVAPSHTPWCSSYWKWSLWVTVDYSRQLYFYLQYAVAYNLFLLFLNIVLYSIYQIFFLSSMDFRRFYSVILFLYLFGSFDSVRNKYSQILVVFPLSKFII